MISKNELLNLPVIQLFLSPACNLKCTYCSQISVHTQVITDDFSKNEELLKFIETIPRTHFYISGGEPLIHDGIFEFIKKASEFNHKVSLDTNLVCSDKIFNKILSLSSDVFGFFNISHHIDQKVALDFLMKRSKQLRENNIDHFIKYIGVPEDLDTIIEYKKILVENKIGFAFTPLQHLNWNGRVLPQDYTFEELDKCFSLVSTKVHALQFFDGIKSKGLSCRGGNDFIVMNMLGDHATIPCCHTSSHKIDINDTFFVTSKKEPTKCVSDSCIGDLMFILGINYLYDEVEDFYKVLKGEEVSFSKEQIIDYLNFYEKQKIEIINYKKFYEYRRNYE